MWVAKAQMLRCHSSLNVIFGEKQNKPRLNSYRSLERLNKMINGTKNGAIGKYAA